MAYTPPWFAWLKKTFIVWKLPEKKEEDREI